MITYLGLATWLRKFALPSSNHLAENSFVLKGLFQLHLCDNFLTLQPSWEHYLAPFLFQGTVHPSLLTVSNLLIAINV